MNARIKVPTEEGPPLTLTAYKDDDGDYITVEGDDRDHSLSPQAAQRMKEWLDHWIPQLR